MKKLLLSLVCAGSAGALWAVLPSVDNVRLSQDPGSGNVVITYDLKDADAIVTVDILSGGASVLSGDERANLTGDAAKFVSAGTGKTVTWRPSKFPGLLTAATARVTAWEPANPPDYLVVDLTAPNVRWYYEKEGDLPFGGISNVLYKTDRLVMRKIPAKDVIWRMGQPYPNGEPCDNSNDRKVDATVLDAETGHMVKLTEDYYIGIYPVTRRQYWRVTGSDSNGVGVYPTFTYNEMIDGWTIPVNKKKFNELRGTPSGSFKSWPDSGHDVASSSVIQTFRTFTGLNGLDLPTEAMWEYACRAGTSTSLNNGLNNKTTRNWADANAADIAWYGNNYGTSGGQYMHPVGLKQGNAFGLYDMHGNAAEMCLDRYAAGDTYRATFVEGWENGAVTVDPKGPSDATLTETVGRGGDYFFASTYARSASRVMHQDRNPASANQHYGFRLVCSLPVK